MDERRVNLGELARAVVRIDRRTERIEHALFEGEGDAPGIMTRIALLEQARADDDGEKKLSRVMVAIGTLIGSGVGAALALIGIGTQHK